MKRYKLRIPVPAGKLETVIDDPETGRRGLLLVAHPHPLHGGSLDNKVVTTLAKAANEAGWVSVRPLQVVAAESPDLVVLDVMLPKRSGFDVLRELRAGGPAPAVIMLTARDEVIDRVAGLEIGADDYVTKPFEPRELVARVGAVLRRMSGPVVTESRRIVFDLAVDTGAREVSRGGASLELTRVEFDLLVALTERPGIVLTREQLGELVFGESFDAFDRTIDSHVKNLRHKLGNRPAGGQYVETVRGVGYRAARP